MCPEKDTAHFRALPKAYADNLDIMLRTSCLDIMLRSLLMEMPTTDKLEHLLENVNFRMHSREKQKKARAIQSSTALLRFATCLLGFDNSSDFPKVGYLVAQLGLYITDPADDISRQARGEFTYSTSYCCGRGG
ncbi:maestro heat-like repeat-containing protein family member 7 [Chelonia mydas]|uniref:maestro heat-like repeat-containing protein family member 7 n=1 Tax=Chelonia mydas TaxID=8469 RepID=UPI001CA98F78|nr:maestro heat-like repeat-containing protein family member 7 [Chelonia mydas]